MPPLQHYSQQLIAHGTGAPAMPHFQAPQADDGAGGKIVKHLDDFMRQAGPLLGRAYMAQQTARVDDAVLGVEQKFMEFREKYQQEHQGADAANAAADLAKGYEEIAGKAAQEFDAPGHTVFPDMLRRRLAERGLQAAKEGLAYQARQNELWKMSQWNSQVDAFQRLVASDPLDPVIEREAQTLKDSWTMKHPGQDSRKEFAAIDDITTRGRLDAMLERRDPEGAARLLESLGRAGAQADTRGMEPEVERLVREAGARHGFDEQGIQMLLAQCMQESGGRRGVVSRAGARGPMQLMPGTARMLGVKNIDDIAENIDGGVRYMKQMLKEFGGSWDDALAAYNMGPGGLRQVMAGKRPMPKETRDYVPRIRSRLRPGAHPAMHEQDMQRYRHMIDAQRRQLLAEERGRMELVMRNYVAASEDGHIGKVPYSGEQVARVFGEAAPQVMARMNEAHALAVDTEAAARMSFQQQAELLQRRAPAGTSMTYETEARHYQMLASNLGRMQKLMAEDPAGFVAAHDKDVAKAREAFLLNTNPDTASEYLTRVRAACEMRGMEQRLFSRADAQAIADSISKSDKPMQAAQTMARALGSSFPQAMQEVMPNLAPAMRLMVSAGPDASPEPWRLILQAERARNFEKDVQERLGWEQGDTTDFKSRLHKELEDFHKSFMAGGDREMPRAIESAVAKLSLQYMSRLEMKEKDAVRRAVREVIGSRYEIAEQGGIWHGRKPAARIPKSVDVDGVRKGMEQMLYLPPVEEMKFEELEGYDQIMLREQQQKLVATQGYWICDNEEQGLVLFIGGRAVFGKDGKPFRRTWQQLSKYGHSQIRDNVEPGNVQTLNLDLPEQQPAAEDLPDAALD